MQDVSLAADAPKGALEVDLLELLAALTADPEASKGPGVAEELPRDADRGQRAHGVRQDTEAGTHLAEPRRALQHEHRNAQTLQRGRQRHAADPRARDDDPLRSHRSHQSL